MMTSFAKWRFFTIIDQMVDAGKARAVRPHGTLEHEIEIAVAENGQPRWAQFQRWSNANPEKAGRLQPFDGYFDGFQIFEGFTLPTRVEAGNHFGTEAYFPSEDRVVRFRAIVTLSDFSSVDPEHGKSHASVLG